jgi:hypothetical protein
MRGSNSEPGPALIKKLGEKSYKKLGGKLFHVLKPLT